MASSLAATFLTLPTLHSYSKLRLLSKMHCDFLFSGRTGMEYDPGREEKDFDFSGGLGLGLDSKAKERRPKTRYNCWEGGMINRTRLDPGWDSGAQS